MEIFSLTAETVPAVARLMCTIKPDWWDYDGAVGQLSGTEAIVKTVGWYLGEDAAHPKGWVLCRELLDYLALELECCGYDDDGAFKLEHKLEPLLRLAEQYAREKGYLAFRSGISSIGFNIHEQPIRSIPEAMASLSCDRVDYQWYLQNGFRVMGIQPNAYGKGFHLILLVKDLSE